VSIGKVETLSILNSNFHLANKTFLVVLSGEVAVSVISNKNGPVSSGNNTVDKSIAVIYQQGDLIHLFPLVLAPLSSPSLPDIESFLPNRRSAIK
jgi:hypothetical protein